MNENSSDQNLGLAQLAREKKRVSTVLTIIMLGAYLGFIAILAWSPASMSARVGNATLGIPMGIGVIVLACILTGIYVRWANNRYDSLAAQVRSEYSNRQDTTL